MGIKPQPGGGSGKRIRYRCRGCREKFDHEGLPLPEKARYCPACLNADPELLNIRDAAFTEDRAADAN